MKNQIRETYVEMRDGIKLYTIVQLPETGSCFPVIVVRDPYVTKEINRQAMENEPLHGYAVVTQHCRGCGRSEGECIPYINERNDGLDLLDWIRHQDFYNGELFLKGASYLASVHFSYLNTDPPDVKAAFLAVQDTERYNLLYRNGFFKAGRRGWSFAMYKKNSIRNKNFTTDTFRTMPLKGITRYVLGEYAPCIEEEFSHPDPSDPYYSTPEGGSDYSHAVLKCKIPILLVSGFYDIYADGIFAIWDSMSPARRENCALIVTPYSHDYSPDTPDPELPPYPGAKLDPLLYLEWFEHFRIGSPLRSIEKGKTAYYTLFENQWHSLPELKNGPQRKKFFLAPDRTLTDVPAPADEISYIYNPYAPASFRGGICNNFDAMKIQDPPNSRYDIISFLSGELENTLCNGQIELSLNVRSSAPDTCFYVRLSIVKDGKAYSLRDDVDSLCRTIPDYVPGNTATLHFTFAPHSFQIQKGDRLRLDVSSSCFPHLQIHPNRKGLIAEQIGADIARNTILTENSNLILHCI